MIHLVPQQAFRFSPFHQNTFCWFLLKMQDFPNILLSRLMICRWSVSTDAWRFFKIFVRYRSWRPTRSRSAVHRHFTIFKNKKPLVKQFLQNIFQAEKMCTLCTQTYYYKTKKTNQNTFTDNFNTAEHNLARWLRTTYWTRNEVIKAQGY